MAPIPIYSQSPINAAKASGITPQTSTGSPGDSPSASTTTTTTTTAAAGPRQPYPAAQPGSAPSMPAPTEAASRQRYAPPIQPTPTLKGAERDPPPPQPGAVPTLAGATTTLPPPPRAGGAHHAPPRQTAAPSASTVPYPAQMGIPAPAVPPVHRGTATATAQEYYGAASGGDHDHPPGYRQNVNAADPRRSQAPAHFANVSSERHRSGVTDDGYGDDGVWDTAKKFIQTAGNKLSEAESEVWRRINKD